MARHRRAEAPEEDKPELSISPLIDVCFLLLIYFLVTGGLSLAVHGLERRISRRS